MIRSNDPILSSDYPIVRTDYPIISSNDPIVSSGNPDNQLPGLGSWPTRTAFRERYLTKATQYRIGLASGVDFMNKWPCRAMNLPCFIHVRSSDIDTNTLSIFSL